MGGSVASARSLTLPSGQSEHQSTVHQRANFPSDLNLQYTPLDGGFSPHSDYKADVQEFGIAAKTWDAAAHLAYYLTSSITKSVSEFDPPSPICGGRNGRTPQRILDLGSGTCYLPLAIADAFRPASVQIVATDLPEVLPLMRRNLRERPSIVAHPLPWGDVSAARDLCAGAGGGFDVVLCSDLVYFEFLYAPLVKTLLVLTQNGAVVVFGYKERVAVKEDPFFALLGRYFHLTPVLSRTVVEPCSPTNLSSTSAAVTAWARHHPTPSLHLLHASRRSSTTALSLEEISGWTPSEVGRCGDLAGEGQWETIKLMDIDVDT